MAKEEQCNRELKASFEKEREREKREEKMRRKQQVCVLMADGAGAGGHDPEQPEFCGGLQQMIDNYYKLAIRWR